VARALAANSASAICQQTMTKRAPTRRS
jgi:hypothetical protein